MSGFASLYYTDCRQGQGLRGGAGFQFQAVSDGTSHEVMALVERSALYEAPVSWMREKRPVADYPPSLAHVFDGGYVTARGVYLGAEAGGVREGNQFTHALSTSDARLYGPVRPAQLWDAPCWSEKPAASTGCEPVPAEPEPGPCGVDVVREWVLGRHDGESWLLAVNSALERVHDRGAARVVFVGAEADEIVRWIAAGTLLLPQEVALRIGFRVFTTNPQYSRHEVLGLHPDWAGRLADVARDDGFVVFNLESGRHSPVEPTASALHWVPRFLRADPFDVVDAVELAHRFASDGKRERAAAGERLAGGVLALGDAVEGGSDALELAGWLAAEPAISTADAHSLTEAILAARPAAPVLWKLASSVHTGRSAGAVRLALLRAELDELVRGTRTVQLGTLPADPWSQDELERALTLFEAAGNHVPPERMDLLLRLAGTFGITPRVDEFRDAAARFVRWWADTPGAPVSPDQWPCGPRIIGLLRDELAFRLRGPHTERTATAIRERWWALLLPTVRDPFARLDTVVANAAVAAGGQSRRDAIAAMRAMLRDSARDDAGDVVWEALFGRNSPSVADLAELIPGNDIPESLAQKAIGVLQESPVDEQQLEVLRELGEHVRAESLLALRTADDALRGWLAALTRNTYAQPLDDVPEAVVAARTSNIIAVLLRIELTRAEDAVVRSATALQQLLVRELPAVWDDDSTDRRKERAVALGYLIGSSDELPETLRREWGEVLKSWTNGHGPPDHARISRLLRAEEPEAAVAWHAWIREVGTKKPRKNSVANRLFGQRRGRGE